VLSWPQCPAKGTTFPRRPAIESFKNLLEITSADLKNGQFIIVNGIAAEQAMSVMSLSRAATYRVSGWSKLESLFA
jgi:hypothetical protein